MEDQSCVTPVLTTGKHQPSLTAAILPSASKMNGIRPSASGSAGRSPPAVRTKTVAGTPPVGATRLI